MKLQTLNDAVFFFEETMARHPERELTKALEAVWHGERPRYPAFSVSYRVDPLDQSDSPLIFHLPETHLNDDPEGRLAKKIVDSLAPLDLHNAVSRSVSLEGSSSPADLVPSFGIPLGECQGAPAYTVPLEEMLKRPLPDPDKDGLMPVFKASAAQLRDLLPPTFTINPPDMQGPFNLVHAMTGDDAFTAPYTDPDLFHEFMGRVTDFWIEARRRFVEWIGQDRLPIRSTVPRIAECSVNMVSEDFYKEFILPYDRRITDAFGPVLIHPCSGEHVFKETFENLPVAATEAGLMIAPMASPMISVKRASEIVGNHPTVIDVGQELPEDPREACKIIAADFDSALANSRIRPGFYTGLFWRKKDRPMIRELHLELDQLWETKRAAL